MITNTVLDDISHVIGFTATQRLAVWYGDTNLYVPTFMAEDHALVGLIGESSYRALVGAFGGKTLWVPLGTAEADRTQKRIAEMIVLGNHPQQIADVLGMSVKRIRQVIDALRSRGLIALVAKRAKESARQNRGAKPAPETAPGKPPGKTPQESPDRVSEASNDAGKGELAPRVAHALDDLGLLWRGAQR